MSTDESLVVSRSSAPAEELIGRIDRSEEIRLRYEVRDGGLVSVVVVADAPAWDPSGSGPHSVAAQAAFLGPILDRGAVALIARLDGDPVGVAVVELHFDRDLAWLAWMHVTARARRRGVATALWSAAVESAVEAGDGSMYVSATPSGSAVGFYLSRGCQLATPPHPNLFAAEPEDIHLVKTFE